MHKKKSLEHIIKSYAKTREEREELWRIVEEIMHHRIMGCVLDNLPKEHHDEFLDKLSKSNFNEELIEYLNKKTNKNMDEEIAHEIELIEKEILQDIK